MTHNGTAGERLNRPCPPSVHRDSGRAWRRDEGKNGDRDEGMNGDRDVGPRRPRGGALAQHMACGGESRGAVEGV